MNHRKVLKLGVYITLLFLLSGCWDATDVDELAMILP
jgi:hypothetical protein